MINNYDFIRESLDKSGLDIKEINEKTLGLKSTIKNINGDSLSDIKKLLNSLPQSNNKSKELGSELFNSESIYNFNLSLSKLNINADTYIQAFIEAARLKLIELLQFEISEKNLQIRSIDNGENIEFHKLLIANKVRSWLVAIGIYEGINYDTIHKMGGYNFTNKKNPNLFAYNTAAYINGSAESPIRLVADKRILSVGSGNGIDEIYFVQQGAKEVATIESSNVAFQMMKRNREMILDKKRDKLTIPPQPVDMFNEISRLAEQGEKFDTIYCHSTLHYFDNSTLISLLTKIGSCLNENGYLSTAIKAPGAILDGNGIPLIIDEEIIKRRSKNMTVTHLRGWLNNDTHTRFFRDREVLIELIESIQLENGYQFEIRSDESFMIEDYDASGLQPFYRLHIKKVKS